MPLDLEDTIVARASAPGAAQRGIVRISGPGTAAIVAAVFRPDESSAAWRQCRLPRRFSGVLQLESIGVPIPVALMYWPTCRSYTGQPSAEFHMLGSEPLLDATQEDLCRNGARLARHGEFTMRAFLNGRIDLLQAEAVLGVIHATDHDELQQALSQLGGGLTSRLRELRKDLIALLGDLEAGLDFVEEDIEFVSREEIVRRLQQARTIVAALAGDSASRLPAGYRRRVVLAGLPNAGKSTLFNRVLGEHKAIVSPVPGTTRDYLTATVQVCDLQFELIDTAGWEQASDLIMQHAQALRSQQLSASDIVLWCSAADACDADVQIDQTLREQLAATGTPLFVIQTRTDCSPSARLYSPHDLQVSAVTGKNMDQLLSLIQQRLMTTGVSRSGLLASTSIRCRDSLLRTLDSLDRAITSAECESGDEILSLEIRQSLQELSVILGEVYTDDILDHIFSSFCIGK
jgi:tRNA modification GTPase